MSVCYIYIYIYIYLNLLFVQWDVIKETCLVAVFYTGENHPERLHQSVKTSTHWDTLFESEVSSQCSLQNSSVKYAQFWIYSSFEGLLERMHQSGSGLMLALPHQVHKTHSQTWKSSYVKSILE